MGLGHVEPKSEYAENTLEESFAFVEDEQGDIGRNRDIPCMSKRTAQGVTQSFHPHRLVERK